MFPPMPLAPMQRGNRPPPRSRDRQLQSVKMTKKMQRETRNERTHVHPDAPGAHATRQPPPPRSRDRQLQSGQTNENQRPPSNEHGCTSRASLPNKQTCGREELLFRFSLRIPLLSFSGATHTFRELLRVVRTFLEPF